jgi:hypothetical protein
MSDEKKIEKLKIPEFKSDIPPHLLGECSPQDAYMMEQLSIQKQQNAYIIDTLSDVHYAQQVTNHKVGVNTQRLDTLEEPRKLFKSKPVMIAVAIIAFAFLFVIYPYLLSLEFKELMPLLKDFFL